MKQQRTDHIFLGLSIGGFLAMSCSFLLMPLEATGGAPGLLFWGGLLMGVGFQTVLEIRRRAFFRSYGVRRSSMQKPRNGFLTFGSNKAAVLADSVMFVILALAVPAFVLTKGYGYLCYVCAAALNFSFCMHCILNGRNYFHVNNQLRVRRVLESKSERISCKGEGKHE